MLMRKLAKGTTTVLLPLITARHEQGHTSADRTHRTNGVARAADGQSIRRLKVVAARRRCRPKAAKSTRCHQGRRHRESVRPCRC
jgi:hypothetical protein